MKRFDPKHLLIIGFCCLMVGVLLPLLMVIKVLESTLFLNIISYVSSLIGTILGTIGTGMYIHKNRNK